MSDITKSVLDFVLYRVKCAAGYLKRILEFVLVAPSRRPEKLPNGLTMEVIEGRCGLGAGGWEDIELFASALLVVAIFETQYYSRAMKNSIMNCIESVKRIANGSV